MKTCETNFSPKVEVAKRISHQTAETKVLLNDDVWGVEVSEVGVNS